MFLSKTMTTIRKSIHIENVTDRKAHTDTGWLLVLIIMEHVRNGYRVDKLDPILQAISQ
jgi:hypothetical protein